MRARAAQRPGHPSWRHLTELAGPLAVTIELEAAFQVFARGCVLSDARAFRQRVLSTPRRDLHAAVGRILMKIPARRNA